MVFGQQTPPAGFPVLLGLLGLGHAWRNAASVYGAMGWLGEVLLGAAVALFLAGFAGYAVKLVRRPAVIAEDLRILPGRAGLAALTMSWMLVAAALLPYAPGLATRLLVAALLGHVVVMLLTARALMQLPPEGRGATPVWHLTFVGPIVGAVMAAKIGWGALAVGILFATALAAIVIYGATLTKGAPQRTAPPLRPTLAIHLSPVSLFGLVALGLGQPGLATAMGAAALLIFLGLGLNARWMIAGGFSALWGAFTFPLAAFASLMVLLGPQSGVFQAAGLLGLALATLAIPPIALRVIRLWVQGKLGPATNAASA